MLLCSIEEAWGNDFINNPKKNNVQNSNKNNVQNSNKNKKSNISNNKKNTNLSIINKSIKTLKGGKKYKENMYNNIIIFTIIGYIMLFISHICFELGFELNN
jgi:ABC-type transport system involved in multi-copper enzyme maturation permease subunit